jgi:RNA polymerase sigma factor for flagellar operon FliA
MLDEMRSRDWIPRSVRQKMRELEALQKRLAADLSRVPEDQEIAKALEMSLEDYYSMILYVQPGGMISYDEVVKTYGDDKNLLDYLEDRSSPHPDLEIQIKDLKRRIIDALEKLTSDEQICTALYYYEGLTLKEIAEVLKVSESRVSQIHARALVKLNWKLAPMKENIEDLEHLQSAE